MKFQNRLKKLRKDKGFTQKQLAEALNTTVSAISHYERGTREPSLDMLVQMTKILGVSVDYLVGSTDANILPQVMNKTYCKRVSTGAFLQRALQLDTVRREALEYFLKCVSLDQFSSKK